MPLSAFAGTTRVSVGPGGVQGNDLSEYPTLTTNGRLAAFHSFASNLVGGDTNQTYDVFVRDRQAGTTQRVSVGQGSVQADRASYNAIISATGRFVAFESEATNLVAGDTDGWVDIYVRDRQAGTTQRVTIGVGGAQPNFASASPAISADGRFVAFDSGATNLVPNDTNGQSDVFVRDRQAGTTQRVSVSGNGAQGNGGSYQPELSADGRFVIFYSSSSNLVPGDTNGQLDVFVRDRQTNTTQRVSVGQGNAQASGASAGQAISPNGRFVAFESNATNLVSGDTNRQGDIFVRDRQTGTTQRVNLGPGGVQANGSSAADAISADGRFVAFTSVATNLVAGDTNRQRDMFVRDRKTGKTQRVNLGASGAQANGLTFGPALSADGKFIAFFSEATNLVPGDTNNSADVFVRDFTP